MRAEGGLRAHPRLLRRSPLPARPRRGAMAEPATQMAAKAADLKASVALCEALADALEKNADAATASVASEFDEIIMVLNEREEDLLAQAKELDGAKLLALQAHAHKLESLMEQIDDAPEDVLQNIPHPRVTSQLVLMPGPKVGKDQERFDRSYPSLGQINDKSGIPVAIMFEAAASQPTAHGFFAKVLGLMGQIDTSAEAGLVTEDDMEMLVAMLEEFPSEQVMAEAAPAICNLAGSNPALGRRFVKEGAVPAMLQWFESYPGSEQVCSGVSFSLGVLAQDPANQATLISAGVVERLVATMKANPDSAEVAGNCLFTLAGLITAGGRDQFVEVEGVDAVHEFMVRLAAPGSDFAEASGLTNVMKTLTAVAKGGDDYKTLCTDTGCTALAIAAMNEHISQPRLLDAGCAYLACLLEGEDSERDRRRDALKVLVQGGVFTMLMEAVGKFNTDQQLSTNVFHVFKQFGELAKKKEVSKTGLLLGNGVKNIAKAMETHPRARDLNLAACEAITSLSTLSSEFRDQLVEVQASKLVAKSLGSFKSSLGFSVAACLCLFVLADGNSHTRTDIGGAQGVWAILEALKLHDGDAITLSGLKAVHAITTDHRSNQQIAAANGAIEAVTEELREHAQDQEICDLGCSILESMMDDSDEIRNQVKFFESKGIKTVMGCAATASVKGALLEILKPEESLNPEEVAKDPTRALGHDAYAFLCDEAKSVTVPHMLKISEKERQREIQDQEIVKFTANASKAADTVEKIRLICVDKTDISIYGGPDDKDDNVFTDVVVNYPLSKVLNVRIVPEYKSAFYIESAGGVVGTVVVSSPKRAKEWRDMLKRLLPMRSGPEGCKQTLMNGKKASGARFLSWVGANVSPPMMMLFVHEVNKKGSLSQIIELNRIVSVTATKKTLSILATLPGGKEAESKFEITSVEEADLWESFIQQYLLEKAEIKEAIRYTKVCEEEKARVELVLEDEPEPEPEPEVEPGSDEDADGESGEGGEGGPSEGVPEGLSMATVTELEKQLEAAMKALNMERVFDVEGKKDLEKEKKRQKKAARELARVKDDIEHEKKKQ